MGERCSYSIARAAVWLLAVWIFELLANPVGAATFVVNSTTDRPDNNLGDGLCDTGFNLSLLLVDECTLRAAIQQAAFAGPNTVSFASARLVPVGAGTVNFIPVSPLPPVVAGVTIDGTTHPSYATADPWAVPIIHLDGTFTGTSDGLRVDPPGTGARILGIAIVNFSGHGILLDDSEVLGTSNVKIEGCHIGLHHGVAAAGNGGSGIFSALSNSAITVGKTCTALLGCSGRGNVISSNGLDGVTLFGNANALAGNRIGTDVTGSIAFGNSGWGVSVTGSSNAVGDLGLVSSVPVASGNLISANGQGGVRVSGSLCGVHANRIGTNAAGSAALQNFGPGVLLLGDQHDVGDDAAGGNLISGNLLAGIQIGSTQTSSSFDDIINNRIGIDATESLAIPNATYGVEIRNGNTIRIEGNRVGGNLLAAVRVTGDRSSVRGNWIGTNAAAADLGNASTGVAVLGRGHSVGGAMDGDGNVIGNNGGSGVVIVGDLSWVAGNYIGTNEQGDDLGNGAAGVQILSTASGNTVGADVFDSVGDLAANANEIAFNVGAGIAVTGSATLAALRGNATHDNGGPGIDLGEDGVTPNDFGDTDSGPNRLLNFPELDPVQTQLNEQTGNLEVRYRVDANVGDATYPLTIDFYLAVAGDEGEIWLGTDAYPQLAAGSFRNISLTPPTGVSVLGQLVATTTDAEDGGNTSEFSAAVPVPEPGFVARLSSVALVLSLLRRGPNGRSARV